MDDTQKYVCIFLSDCDCRKWSCMIKGVYGPFDSYFDAEYFYPVSDDDYTKYRRVIEEIQIPPLDSDLE